VCLKLWQAGYEIADSPDSYIEHCVHIAKKVRESNKSSADWENYLKMVRIFYNSKTSKTGGWIEKEYKEYKDPVKTYKKILRYSPSMAELL